MARMVALFESYPDAHAAAQALIASGQPADVTYLLARGDQAADGMEGFYPGLTPAQGPPGDGGAGEHPFAGPAAGRFAVTGADSLAAPRSLPARLAALGLDAGAVHRVLDQVGKGRVAAVFSVAGPADAAMRLLAERGALAVERL